MAEEALKLGDLVAFKNEMYYYELVLFRNEIEMRYHTCDSDSLFTEGIIPTNEALIYIKFVKNIWGPKFGLHQLMWRGKRVDHVVSHADHLNLIKLNSK